MEHDRVDHEPCGPAAIIQIPGGILLTRFFEFSAGYNGVSTLTPGRGYWVKSAADGRLVLTSGPNRPASKEGSLLKK